MNVLHSSTVELITRLRDKTPQSLLLTGLPGVGLNEIAHLIAEGSEVSLVTPDESKPSRPITTEAIRHLYDSTRSKSIQRQYVIIHDAHTMTHGAQTAFLKLLEEPNSMIHFILTSSQPAALLPTIHSRVQQHQISPVTLAQSNEYLTQLGVTNDTMRRQLLYIAEGLPEELARLVADEEYFNAAADRMKDARALLQASPYDKLVIINSYRENRTSAIQLVLSASHMTRRSLSQRPQKALIDQLDKLTRALERLEANSNVRLALTRLVL